MTWILTHTGKRFDPLAPRAADIDHRDIAHALANLCRFNGHCTSFYSVADHSVGVAELVDPEWQMDGLLHDATEAYIGDITRPLKRGIDDLTGGVLTIIEREIHHCVAERFGISPTMPDQVKHADLDIRKVEKFWFIELLVGRAA